MTSDDRAHEPAEGTDAPSVPEPPTAEGTGSVPSGPGTPAPDGAAPHDSTAWGTSSSPVYGAGAAPGAGDTQPISTALNDTQPLTWSQPTPPSVVPRTATPTPPAVPTPAPAAPGTDAGTDATDPWAVRRDVTAGDAVPAASAAAPSPYGGAPAAPYGSPAPYSAAPSPGATAPGTPPPPAASGTPAPPYGTPPVQDPSAAAYGGVTYGAPGAPGYGPGYGPQGYPPPYPGAPVPTDGMAVASLVTSVGGLVVLCGLTGPVGLGLGIAALPRIRRSGARGRGMAIAGIVVGAIGTAVLVAVVAMVAAMVQWGQSQAEQVTDITGSTSELDRLLDDLASGSDSGSGSGSGSGSADDLDQLLGELGEQLEGLGEEPSYTLPDYALPQDVAVGTCWATAPGTFDLSDAVAVPCEQEHTTEVVARLEVTGTPAADGAPEDPVYVAASTQCADAVDALDPGLTDRGWADVWLPHPDQAVAGELVAYCVYEGLDAAGGSLVASSGTQP
ncbi:DUF4190 domain-containing protein [Cellulomonas sp. zg-ZUI199]|uniref:DUF4190 domain-containing protein n=1 Tax=Cellulomonas wangleii TaxID=2816956 RepID=A0ABX8D636_9CELL|nr:MULTISPECIES: DUF4190 domain-containing protein [Cellulomonas]MBO0901414.1 DUF4190 domain-containing protein [Cellulomonas sp. zg-ZUI22]MBO0924718.1 DUF4190 domain-containing protein [Cellulomonas wangleii]QVI62903.1 DUF4190 domain-containing protein [Cellulomonas wangleii]